MYTHLGQGINVLRDPPKSPLKKGDFESGSPFLKGGWGGSNPVEARPEDLCVHGSPFALPLSLFPVIRSVARIASGSTQYQSTD